MAKVSHALARRSGVGRDHRIDPVRPDPPGDGLDLAVVQIGGDLHCQRHCPPMRAGQRLARAHEGTEQRVQLVGLLERAQSGGIGRGDVRGDIACHRIDLAQAGDVIVRGALHWRVEVLADVDAEHPAISGTADVLHYAVQADIVEPEPVDDRVGLRQAKKPRRRVPRLRPRRDRSHFDKTEAERGEGRDVLPVLVQSGGEADRVRKIKPHGAHGKPRRVSSHKTGKAEFVQALERRQAQPVRPLRIEREQERA